MTTSSYEVEGDKEMTEQAVVNRIRMVVEQSTSQGGNLVSGKCPKCKVDFMGPPFDRKGGDPTKTWFKTCTKCHVRTEMKEQAE